MPLGAGGTFALADEKAMPAFPLEQTEDVYEMALL